MSDLILHHYPPSPVSEKIRAGFGLKKLAWRSVEQNRLPERPELFAMTGGYRRIPVLQAGADIYCDTQLILAEMDARHPEPSFFPGGGFGMPFAVSRWTDDELFISAMKVAFAPAADKLPPALVADRTRLYLGPDGDMAKERADLPHTLSQLRAQLGWIEDRLSGGRAYILGDAPGMPDLLVWFIYWFVKNRYAEADVFLGQFPNLTAWAGRVEALGNGSQTPMAPQEALDVAKAATPITPEQGDPLDPQGLAPGMHASVQPLTDSGETAVSGVIRFVSRDRIALTLENPLCGTVAVHFPRVGYRVTPSS
ncbi:MAG: glutathione S-transferase family protein [Rhodobacteraceae bacterium]|nr:glutathione S-transferase family protein [Paracoccaceae bacterium]